MKKDQHCFIISLAVKFVICYSYMYKQTSLLMSTLKICFGVETEKKMSLNMKNVVRSVPTLFLVVRKRRNLEAAK